MGGRIQQAARELRDLAGGFPGAIRANARWLKPRVSRKRATAAPTALSIVSSLIKSP